MPVPDAARPSEKIARLFPQVDPLKDFVQGDGAGEEHGGHAGATRSGRGADFHPSNGSRQGAVAGAPAKHSTEPGRASRPSPPSLSPRPMKRFPIPESAALPRRKRSLSEEERALWESVAKQTKPLRKKPLAAKPPTDSPVADVSTTMTAMVGTYIHGECSRKSGSRSSTQPRPAPESQPNPPGSAANRSQRRSHKMSKWPRLCRKFLKKNGEPAISTKSGRCSSSSPKVVETAARTNRA